MKKLLLCGLIVVLMVCVVPVVALTAVDDYYRYGPCGIVPDEWLITDITENDFPITPPITIEITQQPDHGTALINSDGLLVYKSEDYSGYDSLKYRLYNGNEYSNEATVNYKVNYCMIIPDQDLVYQYGACISQTERPGVQIGYIWIFDVASPFNVEITQQPDHGTVELIPVNYGLMVFYGSVNSFYEILSGSTGYLGPASFRLRIYDEYESSNEFTVNIQIVPGEQGSKESRTYSTPKDTLLKINDLEGPCLDDSFFNNCVLSPPSHGSLDSCTIDPWSSPICYNYVPDAGFTGIDQFTHSKLYDSAEWICVVETTVNINVGDPPYPIPGYTNPPTDPDGDGIYEDLNANGRLDFADVVLYFNQMTWIAANEPIPAFDMNGNGRIDFADIVALFNEI